MTSRFSMYTSYWIRSEFFFFLCFVGCNKLSIFLRLYRNLKKKRLYTDRIQDHFIIINSTTIQSYVILRILCILQSGTIFVLEEKVSTRVCQTIVWFFSWSYYFCIVLHSRRQSIICTQIIVFFILWWLMSRLLTSTRYYKYSIFK